MNLAATTAVVNLPDGIEAAIILGGLVSILSLVAVSRIFGQVRRGNELLERIAKKLEENEKKD